LRLTFLGWPTDVDCPKNGEVIVPFQPVWLTRLVRFWTLMPRLMR